MSRNLVDDDGVVMPEKGDRLAAAIDVGALLTVLWLILWLVKMPAVDDVIKGGDHYRSFWASIWPLAVAACIALLGGIGAFAGLRRGLIPDKLIWLRWFVVGGVIVVAGLLGYFAPAVSRNADALRKYMDFQLVRIQDVDKEVKDKALRAAEQLGDEKAKEAARKAIEDADKRLKAQQEESRKGEEELRKLMAAAEHGNQDAKKKLDEALTSLAKQKAQREKAEARAKQLEEEAKSGAQADNIVGGDKSAGKSGKNDDKSDGIGANKPVPNSGGSDKDDPVADFVKKAIIAAAFYYNPALGAVLSQVFGITLGTDVETIKTVGDAVLETFPGGKFDPTMVDAALQKLQGLGVKSERAMQAYQETLERMQKEVDVATKAQIEAAIEQLQKARETASGELVKNIRTAVVADWDKVVQDVSKPDDLVKLYRQVKESKFQAEGPQVKTAVLEVAEQKKVQEAVRKAAGGQMQ